MQQHHAKHTNTSLRCSFRNNAAEFIQATSKLTDCALIRFNKDVMNIVKNIIWIAKIALFYGIKLPALHL